MSKTISVTIPEIVEEKLNKKAKELGFSRSRVACDALINWYDDQKHKENMKKIRELKGE